MFNCPHETICYLPGLHQVYLLCGVVSLPLESLLLASKVEPADNESCPGSNQGNYDGYRYEARSTGRCGEICGHCFFLPPDGRGPCRVRSACATGVGRVNQQACQPGPGHPRRAMADQPLHLMSYT